MNVGSKPLSFTFFLHFFILYTKCSKTIARFLRLYTKCSKIVTNDYVLHCVYKVFQNHCKVLSSVYKCSKIIVYCVILCKTAKPKISKNVYFVGIRLQMIMPFIIGRSGVAFSQLSTYLQREYQARNANALYKNVDLNNQENQASNTNALYRDWVTKYICCAKIGKLFCHFFPKFNFNIHIFIDL